MTNTTLTLDGTDFSGHYQDLGFYQDINRETHTSLVTALAVDNAAGPLLAFLAGHVGDTVLVVAVCRGVRITGDVTVTGASRLTFDADNPATVQGA